MIEVGRKREGRGRAEPGDIGRAAAQRAPEQNQAYNYASVVPHQHVVFQMHTPIGRDKVHVLFKVFNKCTTGNMT
jgi:hypothetical protein